MSDPTGSFEFVDSHQPPLTAGDHKITARLTIKSKHEADDSRYKFDESFGEVTKNISISGPRFSLSPKEIYTLFPPPGSLGDHANVLPHIVLTRSTLPWERHPWRDAPETLSDKDKWKRSVSWLALLAFHAEEEVKVSEPPLRELSEYSKMEDSHFPEIEIEMAQSLEDKLTVLDVKRGKVESILPSAEQLHLLSHVRHCKDAGQTVKSDPAVIMANRLPKPKGATTVHLVSLEKRYNGDGTFDFLGAGDNDFIRFVSLKSWQFSCLKPEHTFTELLKGLKSNTLQLPYPPRNSDEKNPEAKNNLQMGRIPLKHQTRSGQETLSWYGGPLAPGPGSGLTLPQPVRTADNLLRYNPTLGMVDVSYAAAWELGRLLMLRNKNASVALFNWKRCCTQGRKAQDKTGPHCCPDHLPFQGEQRRFDFPLDWFAGLACLGNVPFNYLVPDEKMLPRESIRFFQVDPIWIDCLIDGAFSIGSVTHEECMCDCDNRNAELGEVKKPQSGFLLRSEVVAGWPDLQIDGYETVLEGGDPSPPSQDTFKPKTLSKNVLMCLFDKVVHTVDIHLPPEVLHFGFKKESDGSYSKQAGEVYHEILPGQTVNIQRLATDLSAETSAKFAAAMIDGPPRVRFKIGQ
ncbi:MAG: hypothetical protein ABFS45_03530 [Pseudomonadota bacterium]